jgi:hypothetical protein
MRPPIAVISFNRPQFLGQVLASLKAQRGGRLAERELHLFQDGAVNRYSRIRYASDIDIAASVEIFREHFPNGTVHQSADNLGICENYRRAERHLFEEREFDVAFFLEDDLVLSPVYIEMMDRLCRWAETRPNVAHFAAYGDYYSEQADIAARRRDLATLDHHWGFGLIRRHWRKMQGLLEPYYEIVCGNDYSRRDHRKIYALYTPYDLAPRASSQDAAKAFACDRLGLWRANSVVPFARYIGNVGQHMTPKVFAAIGFDRATVASEPVEDLDLPSEAEIERHLTDQRARFVEIRSAEFVALVGALPAREYNPVRLCERDEVIFGHRLFLNREPAAKQVRAELARRRSVFQFVTALAETESFRKMAAGIHSARLCSRDDVNYVYRLCLHCDPESEQLFEAHVGKTDAGVLARATWDSHQRKNLWASIELPD